MLDNGSQQVAILFGLLLKKSLDGIRLARHNLGLVKARPAAGKWGLFLFHDNIGAGSIQKWLGSGYISVRKRPVKSLPTKPI
jgi:hypothetical protein